MDFGQYFKELRREHKFTQRELAKKIGVSHTYISKIENDALPAPSRDMLENVAKVYKMDSANDLLIAAKIIPNDVKNAIREDEELLRFLIETPLEDILKIKEKYYLEKIKNDN